MSINSSRSADVMANSFLYSKLDIKAIKLTFSANSVLAKAKTVPTKDKSSFDQDECNS